MNRSFFKYRGVIINAVILFSLITALILQNGDLKDFFLGLATGAALINFGKAIGDSRSKASINYITDNESSDGLNMN
jgi:hypothetical protein